MKFAPHATKIEPDLEDLVAIGVPLRALRAAETALLHRWGPAQALPHLREARKTLDAAIARVEASAKATPKT